MNLDPKQPSAFESLLEQTKPPAEPYIVPVGEIGLEFRPIVGRRDWDDLVSQAKVRSSNIAAEGSAAAQFQRLSQSHKAQALALAKLMTGVYRKIDPETKLPLSEREPPFSVAAWLEMCESRPSIFDAIFSSVNAAQSGVRDLTEAEAVHKAGEDCGATSG